MRGRTDPQAAMLTPVSPEQRVPKTHPLRRIKQLADAALQGLRPTFDAMYAEGGRPSVPPERLLKSTLLMAFYSVRSDRLFCEQLDHNLLFRWFLDMDMVEEAFNRFSKNRERLLEHGVAKKFLAEIVQQARSARLMSDDHFTVDGTLIEAWASLKSFKPKDGGRSDGPPDDPSNPTVNFRNSDLIVPRRSRGASTPPGPYPLNPLRLTAFLQDGLLGKHRSEVAADVAHWLGITGGRAPQRRHARSLRKEQTEASARREIARSGLILVVWRTGR